MAGLKNVELEVHAIKDLALIAQSDSVWVVVHSPWWDLATWIWWWFCPSDKRATVKLTLTDNKTIRTKAIRIATRHIRVRGLG